ncbi:transglycosylase SLT domain-containing protein [Xenorhabdus nematophila]|uniref:lytic transglycosylase domain-containing protein n=1 Tax=Xenorhabdus nematophila TaxID=628 RepID=UPI0032B7B9A4
MGNVFDFELNADENATKALAEIEARIKQLNPLLGSTREALRFGGSETVENTGALSNNLRNMSRFAQDNVQNIGSMIPPLKNFGELFSKYSGMASKMGLFGGIGGVVGGMTAGYKTLREMGKEATTRSTRAKNAGMSIEDFTRMSGAMHISTGASMDETDQSVESLYPVLQNALTNRNSAIKAELNKIGVEIAKNKNGNADVYQTMKNLAAQWNNIVPETQDTLRKHLGLDDNTLSFLRDGGQKKEGKLKIEELLNKSDKSGLTQNAEENQKLTDFDSEMNEASARFSGMWNRTKIDTATWLLDKGAEAEKKLAWQTIKDIRMRESDTADNFYHGNKEKDIRKWAVSDKDFLSQLTFMEEFHLLRGKPDKNLQKKLDDRYGESWEKQKKAHEAKEVAKQIPVAQKIEAPDYPNPLNLKGAALLESMSDYFAMLEKKYGHEPGLLHGVAMTESSGDPSKIGPMTYTGEQAMGMFQFMPDTAKEQGLSRRDTLDPYKSADASARYLSWLRTKTGSTDGMLAAYNGGIGRLERRGSIRNMPPETRNYIPKVKKYMKAGAAIAEKNAKKSPTTSQPQQPFPSLYGQKKESGYEEVAANIAKVVREAIGDKPFLVEIALVDNKTGERQKFQEKTTGKVTTSMRYP